MPPKPGAEAQGGGGGGDDKGAGGGGLGNLGASDDEEKKDGFFVPISYKKLFKVIYTQHPVDPETKQRFNFNERITVKDYIYKITDCCYCYAITQKLNEVKRYCRKRFGGAQRVKFDRPESMRDLPSSDSNSEDTEEQ